MKLTEAQAVFIETFQKTLSCTECGNIFRDPHVLTSCHHNFCRECIPSNLAESGCPLCTTPAWLVDLKKNVVLAGVVTNFAELKSELQELGMLGEPQPRLHQSRETQEGDLVLLEAERDEAADHSRLDAQASMTSSTHVDVDASDAAAVVPYGCTSCQQPPRAPHGSGSVINDGVGHGEVKHAGDGVQNGDPWKAPSVECDSGEGLAGRSVGPGADAGAAVGLLESGVPGTQDNDVDLAHPPTGDSQSPSAVDRPCLEMDDASSALAKELEVVEVYEQAAPVGLNTEMPDPYDDEGDDVAICEQLGVSDDVHLLKAQRQHPSGEGPSPPAVSRRDAGPVVAVAENVQPGSWLRAQPQKGHWPQAGGKRPASRKGTKSSVPGPSQHLMTSFFSKLEVSPPSPPPSEDDSSFDEIALGTGASESHRSGSCYTDSDQRSVQDPRADGNRTTVDVSESVSQFQEAAATPHCAGASHPGLEDAGLTTDAPRTFISAGESGDRPTQSGVRGTNSPYRGVTQSAGPATPDSETRLSSQRQTGGVSQLFEAPVDVNLPARSGNMTAKELEPSEDLLEGHVEEGEEGQGSVKDALGAAKARAGAPVHAGAAQNADIGPTHHVDAKRRPSSCDHRIELMIGYAEETGETSQNDASRLNAEGSASSAGLQVVAPAVSAQAGSDRLSEPSVERHFLPGHSSRGEEAEVSLASQGSLDSAKMDDHVRATSAGVEGPEGVSPAVCHDAPSQGSIQPGAETNEHGERSIDLVLRRPSESSAVANDAMLTDSKAVLARGSLDGGTIWGDGLVGATLAPMTQPDGKDRPGVRPGTQQALLGASMDTSTRDSTGAPSAAALACYATSSRDASILAGLVIEADEDELEVRSPDLLGRQDLNAAADTGDEGVGFDGPEAEDGSTKWKGEYVGATLAQATQVGAQGRPGIRPSTRSCVMGTQQALQPAQEGTNAPPNGGVDDLAGVDELQADEQARQPAEPDHAACSANRACVASQSTGDQAAMAIAPALQESCTADLPELELDVAAGPLPPPADAPSPRSEQHAQVDHVTAADDSQTRMEAGQEGDETSCRKAPEHAEGIEAARYLTLVPVAQKMPVSTADDGKAQANPMSFELLLHSRPANQPDSHAELDVDSLSVGRSKLPGCNECKGGPGITAEAGDVGKAGMAAQEDRSSCLDARGGGKQSASSSVVVGSPLVDNEGDSDFVEATQGGQNRPGIRPGSGESVKPTQALLQTLGSLADNGQAMDSLRAEVSGSGGAAADSVGRNSEHFSPAFTSSQPQVEQQEEEAESTAAELAEQVMSVAQSEGPAELESCVMLGTNDPITSQDMDDWRQHMGRCGVNCDASDAQSAE